MRKVLLRPNVGGWIFYTAKDPKKFLHTLWKVARVYDAGLLPSSANNGYLEFKGVTVRIQDENVRQIDEFVGDDLNHEIQLLLIDWKDIRPGFFKLWDGEIKDGHIKGESLLELKDALDREEARLNGELSEIHRDPGAPVNVEDLWAWGEMHKNDRSDEEVKPEWIEKVQGNPKRKEWTKDAIYRRWREIRRSEWGADKWRRKKTGK